MSTQAQQMQAPIAPQSFQQPQSQQAPPQYQSVQAQQQISYGQPQYGQQQMQGIASLGAAPFPDVMLDPKVINHRKTHSLTAIDQHCKNMKEQCEREFKTASETCKLQCDQGTSMTCAGIEANKVQMCSALDAECKMRCMEIERQCADTVMQIEAMCAHHKMRCEQAKRLQELAHQYPQMNQQQQGGAVSYAQGGQMSSYYPGLSQYATVQGQAGGNGQLSSQPANTSNLSQLGPHFFTSSQYQAPQQLFSYPGYGYAPYGGQGQVQYTTVTQAPQQLQQQQ